MWSGLFIGLHFKLETGPFFPRPDRIFRSGLQSQLTRPYGPVFFTVSKKGSSLGPDRTVASLAIAIGLQDWETQFPYPSVIAID